MTGASVPVSATDEGGLPFKVEFGIPRDNGRQQAASHPTAVLGWGLDPEPLRHLGHILTPMREI